MPDTNPRITVIIINWNGVKFLERNLSSVFTQSYSPFEVILIDNGSTDGSVDFVRSNFSDAILIENRENMGFAAANNQGIRLSRGAYVALINNDATADKDWLEKLAEKAGSAPADTGMWACKILSLQEPGIIDSAGGLLVSRVGIAKGRGRNEKDNGQYDADDEAFIPSACAAMYKKAMLDEIGGFDEDFFAYCEDTDLGLRARFAGWKTQYVPDAIVLHQYSGTTGRYSPMKAFLVERNHIWVALKNFPVHMLAASPFYTLWRYVLQTYAVLAGKGAGWKYVDGFSAISLVVILIKAYISAAKGIPKMLKKRRVIKAQKKVSRREIAGWFKKFGISLSRLVFQE